MAAQLRRARDPASARPPCCARPIWPNAPGASARSTWCHDARRQQQAHFDELRTECIRLVQGWPCVPNYDVALQASTDGARLPLSRLNVVQYLQVAALNRTWPASSACTSWTRRLSRVSSTTTASSVSGGVRRRGCCCQAGRARRLVDGSATYGGMSVSAADARLYAWVNSRVGGRPGRQRRVRRRPVGTPGVRAAFTRPWRAWRAAPAPCWPLRCVPRGSPCSRCRCRRWSAR